MASKRGAIHVTMTAEDAQLWAAWQRAQRGADGVGNAINKIGDNSKKSKDKVSQLFGNIVKDGEKVAMQWVGIGTALAAVTTALGMARKEYDLFVQRQKGAADKQVDYGRALAKATRAYGKGEGGAKQLDDFARATADKYKVDPGRVQELMAGALSAKGRSLSDSAAFETVAMVAKLAPDIVDSDLETATAIVEASLTAQKVNFGGKRLNPAESVSMGLNAYNSARQREIKDFMEIGPGGLMQLAGMGFEKDRPEFLLAMLNAFGHRTDDKEGRRALTNLITTQGQLTTATVPILGKQSVEKQWDWLLNSNDPRAKELQSNILGPLGEEVETAKAKGDLKGEMRTRMAQVEMWSNPNSAFWTEVRGQLADFSEKGVGGPGAEAAAQRVMADFYETGPGKTLALDQAAKSSNARFQLDNPGANRSLALDALRERGWTGTETDWLQLTTEGRFTEDSANRHLLKTLRANALTPGEALKAMFDVREDHPSAPFQGKGQDITITQLLRAILDPLTKEQRDSMNDLADRLEAAIGEGNTELKKMNTSPNVDQSGKHPTGGLQ